MEKIAEKKEKSTIEQLREIRDKVSDETKNMTFSELKEYVECRLQESLYPKTVWMQT
jgi:RNase adaptor protein for sRNA GlmZ degradation